MEQETVIEVNDVSLEFRLYKEKVDSIKEYCIKFLKHELAYENFWALKNVSFDVKRGRGGRSGWKERLRKKYDAKGDCGSYQTNVWNRVGKRLSRAYDRTGCRI